MSAASSTSSSGVQGSTSRPQQYGLVNNNHNNSEHKSVLRQRPPTGEVLAHRNGSNQHHYTSFHHVTTASTTTSVSPFLSPASSFGQQREPLPPLILDPSAGVRSVHSSASDDRGSHHSNITVFHKFWEVASGKRPAPHHRTAQEHPHPQHLQIIESSAYIPEETAGHFARVAPRAGYLQKLGTTIPEFKRRFFVLQPGTHLYYFLSPNDTEPRGCFDLEDSRVEEVDHLPDGRFRFALVWDEHRIVLEARSKDVGQEWIKSLQTERLSYVRAELQDLQRQNDVLRFRLADLEQKVKDYQLVEVDRDAAMDDAARWKEKFEQLDDALRLLTQQMHRPPDSTTEDQGEAAKTTGEEETAENRQDQESHNQQLSGVNNNSSEHDDDESPDDTQNLLNNSRRDTSLLDDDDDPAAQEIEIPGSHFSLLSTACQQVKENLRLAALEASTTAQDLKVANEKIVAMEKRLGRAEKHLCKLWEENCSIRTSLKQKKQEKKILVREYKSLVMENRALQSAKGMRNGQPIRNPQPISNLDVSQDDGSIMTGSEEDRLMNEIEESVISSIRIHEQLLGAGRALSNEFEGSVKVEKSSNTHSRGHDSSQRNQNSSTVDESRSSKHSANPPQNKQSSLFDDESDDSDDNSSAAPSLISSVEAEYGEVDQPTSETESAPTSAAPNSDHNTGQDNQVPQQQQGTPERPNPLLQLDYDDEDEHSSKPNLCATSSQSESSKSLITDNGMATSRLACPLADVVPTQNVDGTHDPSESVQDGQVYHLTFYSRKIGIQFQKVPPPKSKPTGLLTEAMRVELGADPADGLKTAAELRKEGSTSDACETCNVATPVDAVLVCGLAGFDDAANRIRPKLGARLVAFDGISVEVGRWTFDSIRKAIQARGRPLTLSFRNDFLTTEQRSILTKAIAEEGNSAVPPPPRAVNSRPSSTDPSVQSALSHESDYFVNQSDGVGPPRASTSFLNILNDDMSSSAASEHSYPPSSSRASSTFSARRNNYTPGNFRSFSEAGSSSVISSAFAPLMANLMAGALANKKQSSSSFTPEYMRREAGSLDQTPQHQDFTSNLL